MLKIRKEKFITRELENGFKFLLSKGKFLKINKVIRTHNENEDTYRIFAGEDNIEFNGFNVRFVFELDERELKKIHENEKEFLTNKINRIEYVDDFTKWYDKNKAKNKKIA